MSARAVSKGTFARHLKQVADGRESGFFTIVTDTERSVLLRLSGGRITSSRCRGREVDKAIAALAASQTLSYSYTAAAAEDEPQLIGIDDFLIRIGAGIEPGAATGPHIEADGGRPAPRTRRAAETGRDTSVRGTLEALAVDAIGPVAEVVVDEALANNATVQGAIREVALAIPDPEIARGFLEAAREVIPDIEEEL